MEPTVTVDAYDQLATALSKAQAEMENPTFDKENPHFRSKYASLASVRNAIVPVLAKYGIAVIQTITSTERGVSCATTLLHASGQNFVTPGFEVPVTKDDAQGVVSASTYARRISLQTTFVVAAEDDDDGAEAAKRAPPRKAAAPPSKPQDAPEPKVDPWLPRIAACLSGASLEVLRGEMKAGGTPSPEAVAAWKRRKGELELDAALAGPVTPPPPLPTQGGTIAPGVASALEEPPARQKGLMGRVPPKVMTLIERSSPWSAPEAEAISKAMLPLLGAEKWAAMVKDNGGDVSMHMLGLGLDGLRETVARMVDVAGGTTK